MKDNRFFVRATEAEKAAVKELSARLGLTISEFLRAQVRRGYQKEFGTWPPASQQEAGRG